MPFFVWKLLLLFFPCQHFLSGGTSFLSLHGSNGQLHKDDATFYIWESVKPLCCEEQSEFQTSKVTLSTKC